MRCLLLLSLCSVLAFCSKGPSWPVSGFKTEKFQIPRVTIKTTGEVSPGLLFIAPKGSDGHKATSAMIFAQDAQLIWRPEQDAFAYDANTQELNGEPVLTYWTGDHEVPGYGCGFGGVTILDNSYTKLHHVCGDKLDINPIPYGSPKPACLLDSHESRITSRGTILSTARSLTPADLTSVGGRKDGWVLDSVFYELDIATEKVVMRWSTYEHREELSAFKITRYPIKKPDGSGYFGSRDEPWDFAHMNSVQLVPDPLGGYMVSCRYLWSGIKLDKDGNVEWLINGGNGGDFDMPRSANFSYQHAVLASDVTEKSLQLHMFDNANNKETHPKRPSAGLLLDLDLEKKTVRTMQRYSPDKEIVSVRTGNYQPLPWEDKKHVWVDFGHPPIMNEFDADGKVVQEVQCGDLGGDTYRAYKKQWKGFPKTKPKVFGQLASSSEGGTDVWASWNGATEVDRWEFHGRRSAHDHFVFVETAPRRGFETHAQLPGSYSQLIARALHSNGSMLGESEMSNVAPSSGKQTGSAAPLYPGQWTFLALAISLMSFALC